MNLTSLPLSFDCDFYILSLYEEYSVFLFVFSFNYHNQSVLDTFPERLQFEDTTKDKEQAAWPCGDGSSLSRTSSLTLCGREELTAALHISFQLQVGVMAPSNRPVCQE